MDATQAHQALQSAGLPIVGCDSLGNVQYSRELTPAEITTAAQILAAYSEISDPPTFYLHFTLTPGAGVTMQTDGIPLMPNDNAATLGVIATVRATQAADSPVIPYTEAWPIRVRKSAGRIGFITPPVRPKTATPGVYEFDLKFKSKMDSDRYYVDDADFAKVTVGGVIYRIKQATQLIIDVYEAV